jgi:hypothetical protein
MQSAGRIFVLSPAKAVMYVRSESINGVKLQLASIDSASVHGPILSCLFNLALSQIWHTSEKTRERLKFLTCALVHTCSRLMNFCPVTQ